MMTLRMVENILTLRVAIEAASVLVFKRKGTDENAGCKLDGYEAVNTPVHCKHYRMVVSSRQEGQAKCFLKNFS